MFRQHEKRTQAQSALAVLELIYHSTVRNLRKTHGNAIIGLLLNMLQAMVFVIAFYILFEILGLRGTAIRGDFLLFVMSGIFLFMTHTKAIGAIAGAEGATSPMMKHAPMTTAVSLAASALSTLYIQLLSFGVILFVYDVAFRPITLYDPIGVIGMLLLAWASGCAIGLCFFALKPWLPAFVKVGSAAYSRANMIASGKMFVANTMPGYVLAMFDWNPLFHCIDQARGFMFINYNPHFSSIEYPLKVTVILLMLGLMGEFVTRKRLSVSTNAGR